LNEINGDGVFINLILELFRSQFIIKCASAKWICAYVINQICAVKCWFWYSRRRIFRGLIIYSTIL